MVEFINVKNDLIFRMEHDNLMNRDKESEA